MKKGPNGPFFIAGQQAGRRRYPPLLRGHTYQ